MSKRKEENPPDTTPPLAKKKPVSQKNPYVFTRACARLLGVDEEQAVAGYLATTSPRKPNPRLPETAAPPQANPPSDSRTGPSVTHNEVEVRKVAEILKRLNRKLTEDQQVQAQVTESAPAQGEGQRITSFPLGKVPSSSSTKQPITPNEAVIRKVAEILKPLAPKLTPDLQMQARVTESAPAQREQQRITSFPLEKVPSSSSTKQPITPNEAVIRKVAEILKPLAPKLTPDLQMQARVTESAPAQRESQRTTSLPPGKVPSDLSTGQPVTRNEVIREVAEILKPLTPKLTPELQIQAQVTESASAQGESQRTTSLPPGKAPSDVSTEQPVTRNEVEIRKVAEIPKPSNLKLTADLQIQAQVKESALAQGESLATSLPTAKANSHSNTGLPLTRKQADIQKVAEIPKPSTAKLPRDLPIQAQVMASAPARGEGGQATSLPRVKARSASSTALPLTRKGADIRKVAEILKPSNLKLRLDRWVQAHTRESAPAQGPGNRAPSFPRGAPAMLLLVVVGLAFWGLYTKEQRTRVKNSAPPNSSSAALISARTSSASSDSSPADSLRSAEPESSATMAPVSAASLRKTSFVVGIKVRQNVWVSIRADGKKLAEEKLVSGTEKLVPAANQVIVKTGNPGAIDFEFNGRSLPIPGADGEVKTLEFGPGGLEVIISKPPTRIKPGI
jgi:Domain of unknown function (DUF4115)